MEKVAVVSACLAGFPVAYDGKSRLRPELLRRLAAYDRLLYVCPEWEIFGAPRAPIELTAPAAAVFAGQGKVVRLDGKDVTKMAVASAKKLSRAVLLYRPEQAFLREKSPFCGVNCIYNGKFTGTLVKGRGLLAEALFAAGIPLEGVE